MLLEELCGIDIWVDLFEKILSVEALVEAVEKSLIDCFRLNPNSECWMRKPFEIDEHFPRISANSVDFCCLQYGRKFMVKFALFGVISVRLGQIQVLESAFPCVWYKARRAGCRFENPSLARKTKMQDLTALTTVAIAWL